MPDIDIRAILLTVIDEQQPREATAASLHSGSVLNETARRLNVQSNLELQQAILTQWHELFRTGYLAWGFNITNADPPFFHITTQGREALAQLSRDPANPEGYLRHIYSVATLDQVAKSYLEEGLHCYVASLYKASAVMIGGASEAIILQLRDTAKAKIESLGRSVPRDLTDWRIKKILSGLKGVFDKEKNNFPPGLKDEYESYWAAFTQQIRTARNDAGHPSSVDPITPETVHASLLIFSELSKLANSLENWTNVNMT